MKLDLLAMRHFWYVGRWLIWTSVKFPFFGIKRVRDGFVYKNKRPLS
jgi:hypothetical protein